MNRQIKFIDLGMMDFKKAWDYQQNLFDKIVSIKKANRKNNSKFKTPNYLYDFLLVPKFATFFRIKIHTVTFLYIKNLIKTLNMW